MNPRLDIAVHGAVAAKKLGLVSGQVEVTSDCYQMCRGCESWRDHRSGAYAGEWTFLQMHTLFSQIQMNFSHTFEHLSLTGGDPQKWSHLEEFLTWSRGQRRHWDLQISTALTQDIQGLDLWRNEFQQVRVSLDAASPEVYRSIRGDRKTTPGAVLERCAELRHSNLAFITTVFPQNVDEMAAIYERVCDLQEDGVAVRKISFLTALGPRVNATDEIWRKWDKQVAFIKNLQQHDGARVPTSFGEDSKETRAFVESGAMAGCPCRVGEMSFHLKADGGYYPCCLVGGEAIATNQNFLIGKFPEASLLELWLAHTPERHYAEPDSPCLHICQYKQVALNIAAERAANSRLAMP